MFASLALPLRDDCAEPEIRTDSFRMKKLYLGWAGLARGIVLWPKDHAAAMRRMELRENWQSRKVSRKQRSN